MAGYLTPLPRGNSGNHSGGDAMNFEDKNKQPLNGGRVTKGLFLLHGAVHRPKHPNSAFVAGVLAYAYANGLDFGIGEDQSLW